MDQPSSAVARARAAAYLGLALRARAQAASARDTVRSVLLADLTFDAARVFAFA